MEPYKKKKTTIINNSKVPETPQQYRKFHEPKHID